MGTSYYTPRTFRAGQSVFLATAAYEAVKPGFAYSLALTTAELTRQHIPFEIGIMEGNCHVDDGRNTLVRQFMDGNCTDMLFIDSDLMWTAGDVVKILAHKDELVCGAYPKKCSPSSYPIGQIHHARPDGLLEVSYAPTGFMRIRRSVFEKLYPLQSRHGRERPTAVYFERRFNGSTRDGGDVTFCRKWIAAGGKVVVDPHFIFSHIGETRWTGKFLDYLSKDENRERHVSGITDRSKEQSFVEDAPRTYNSEVRTVAGCLARIKAGDDTLPAFEGLADAYGNKPFAATAEFLQTAWRMASNLPEDATILECGSGISTAVLALSGRKVISLEEHGEWAEKADALLTESGLEAGILVSEMNCEWYAAKDRLANLGAAMIVIDGPKRREGINRMWPLASTIAAPGAAVLVDDVSEVTANGDWVAMGTARPFVAGRLKAGAE